MLRSMNSEWSDLAERTEAIAMRRMIDDQTADVRAALGMASRPLADGLQTIVARDPMGGFWNKAIGFCEPLPREEVVDAVAVAREAGAPAMAFCLQPRIVPDDWSAAAAAAGLEAGATMVKFFGPAEPRTDVETDLRIERVDASQALVFAQIMAAGFEVPWSQGVEEMFAATGFFDGDWSTYAAWDADRVVGVARMLAVAETGAVALFGAATLPEARNRGAQSALMAARVAEARDRGLRFASAETWAESAEHPNPSQHNMASAGLTEVHRRSNWVWRA